MNLCLPSRGKTIAGEEPMVVLHVGSGDGRVARYIAEKTMCNVIALESDETLHKVALKSASDTASVKYVHGDVFTLDVEPVSCIVMWYEFSLCDIELREFAFRLFNLLKPGGSLLGEELVSGNSSAWKLSKSALEQALSECGYSHLATVDLASSWRSCLHHGMQGAELEDLDSLLEDGTVEGMRYMCKRPGESLKKTEAYKAEQIRQRSESGAYLRSSCVCVRKASPETQTATGARFEVLLVQRRVYQGADGRWSVPGGGVDPGEDVAMAAHREAEEEAGVLGELGAYLGDFDVSSSKSTALHRTSAYVLHVMQELTNGEWTESLLRHRKWFPLKADIVLRQIRKAHDQHMIAAAERALSDSLKEEAEAV